MSKTTSAEKIIERHVVWALGAGLMPIPLFDIASVTAVQLDMLKQLADEYEVDYSASSGKAFVSALTGSTLARFAASAIKIVPGVGTVAGGISMSAMSAASTYALGQVAVGHFRANRRLLDMDMDEAREAYEETLKRGKEYASGVGNRREAARSVYQTLEKLAELREKGVITDAEFEEQKRKLLEGL